MFQQTTYCDFEGARYLLFGSNVPSIVYYSHLSTIILAIAFAFFVLYQNKKALPNQALFWTLLTFALWVFFALIFWANNRSDVIMLVWSWTILIEPLVYIGCLYLQYTLLEGRDMPFHYKFLLATLYLPIVIFTPTNFNLSGFDIPSCLAIEGPLALYYTYILEFIILFVILFFPARKYLNTKEATKKSRILAVTLGVTLFLLAFSWGNITGSFTDDWQLGQFGLFGMPVFIAFLVYSIVRFRIFNTKLIGAVALVLALVALNFSLLFVQGIEVFRGIAITTFIISAGFGSLLVRSVKNEIKQREKIEKLANDLEDANIQLKELDRQKDELLGIVAHQLSKPITALRWNLESLLDGDLGSINAEQKKETISMRSQAVNLADLVSMILDVSRIQLGKIQLTPQPLNLADLFKEIVDVMNPTIIEKKINFIQKLPKKLPVALLDKRYTRMTIENLLSNAVKYTPEGGKVTLDVSIVGGMMQCSVIDTGLGIPKADQEKIFGKMFRASNVRNTVDGNGFGLYVAKGAIEAQGGTMSFTSVEGKGTTFTAELPIKEA